jgi:hypothetical protein
MGTGKGKVEGGHARGHSNMGYWGTHQEAKADSRRRRRLAERHLEREAAKEAGSRAESAEPPSKTPVGTPCASSYIRRRE